VARLGGRGHAVEAYWAALTHPACDAAIEETLASEIHMVAHDLFAERRAAARRIRGLEAEIGALRGESTGAQHRVAALRRETSGLRDEAVAARRDTAAARAECDRLRSGEAASATQAKLAAAADELNAARAEIEDLRRALRRAEREKARPLERAMHPGATPPEERPVPAEAPAAAAAPTAPANLGSARVLCVGGRKRLVPLYRDAVESARGEFAHHDGGIEDNITRLPTLLGSADAVICLAADCGHQAYYAVKRYCKRYGKPCALLGNSSVHSLAQGLKELAR